MRMPDFQLKFIHTGFCLRKNCFREDYVFRLKDHNLVIGSKIAYSRIHSKKLLLKKSSEKDSFFIVIQTDNGWIDSNFIKSILKFFP